MSLVPLTLSPEVEVPFVDQVEAALATLLVPIGAKVTISGNVVVTTSVTKFIDWTTEIRDDGGFWVVGTPQRFTIPTGRAGWYIAEAGVQFESVTGGQFQVLIYMNGTAATNIIARTGVRPEATVAINTRIGATALVYLVPTDYLIAAVFQTQGGNVNLEPADGLTHFAIAPAGMLVAP